MPEPFHVRHLHDLAVHYCMGGPTNPRSASVRVWGLGWASEHLCLDRCRRRMCWQMALRTQGRASERSLRGSSGRASAVAGRLSLSSGLGAYGGWQACLLSVVVCVCALAALRIALVARGSHVGVGAAVPVRAAALRPVDSRLLHFASRMHPLWPACLIANLSRYMRSFMLCCVRALPTLGRPFAHRITSAELVQQRPMNVRRRLSVRS